MSTPQSQAELTRRYQELRMDVTETAKKLAELEGEKQEHKLVIDTLTPMDPNRKCFRMIGDILVERSAGEVLPAVQANYEQITNVMASLEKIFQEKQKELFPLQRQLNITQQ
ncbi:putative Prefoldin subunit 2 [Blattamonas nauphoetae]|uniref:Prefoldin subunit 2 n=1 Tax=Blattamonas nauphoetae TaxID=2049346 RepID=A0ABQ9XCA3_9EUKA|nr:putative Prefoldin subunit 2 [Blattamonas nauphoetae]